MEKLKLLVESVRLDDEGQTIIGMVTAKSVRKIGRESIASIAMVVRVEVDHDESPAQTRRRVKEEALLFLDSE